MHYMSRSQSIPRTVVPHHPEVRKKVMQLLLESQSPNMVRGSGFAVVSIDACASPRISSSPIFTQPPLSFARRHRM